MTRYFLMTKAKSDGIRKKHVAIFRRLLFYQNDPLQNYENVWNHRRQAITRISHRKLLSANSKSLRTKLSIVTLHGELDLTISL